MTFDELANKEGIYRIVDTKETAEQRTKRHNDFYDFIINKLGYENVKSCIPFTLEQIKSALQNDDKHLNTLPILVWEIASGYIHKTYRTTETDHRLLNLYRNAGITIFSISEGVCILKRCAEIWAEENT